MGEAARALVALGVACAVVAVPSAPAASAAQDPRAQHLAAAGQVHPDVAVSARVAAGQVPAAGRVPAAASRPPQLLYSVVGPGSAVVRLDPVSGVARTVVAAPSNGPTLFANAWSAALARVFYTRSGPTERSAEAVDSVPQAGGRPSRELTGGFTSDVSRDGKRIVYQQVEGQVVNLFVADRGGRNPRRLTGAGGSSPRFSADGRRVVFTRFLGGGQEQEALFTVRPDGTGLSRAIRPANVIYDDPSFSPDGRRLLFSRLDALILSQGVYSVGVDGRGLRLVRADADLPDWGPNGWLTYTLTPRRGAQSDQVVVRPPGLRSPETVRKQESRGVSSLRFAR